MKRFALVAGVLLVGGTLVVGSARADDDDDDDDHDRQGQQGRRRGGEERKGERGGRVNAAALRATPQWAAYQAECGSCHLAFPPGMLPAKSWSTMLGGLADHFGENAEVDAATRASLETWLAANAGPATGGAPQRISTLPWFVREHDEVAPAVYKRKAVLSVSNCGACHPGAAQGAFGENEVKIPRDAPAPR